MDEAEIRKRLAGRAAEYMMFKDDEEENADAGEKTFATGPVPMASMQERDGL